MTLEVPFEGFVEAVRRVTSGLPIFATHENGGTRLTAADPGKGIRVVAFSPRDPGPVTEELRGQGLQVLDGRWMPDDAPAASGEIHVAAVAYRTDGPQPGLWVDAFAEAPTAIAAMRALYDEFRANGEIAEIPFEEFLRVAEPIAVVVGPSELRGYAAAKDC